MSGEQKTILTENQIAESKKLETSPESSPKLHPSAEARAKLLNLETEIQAQRKQKEERMKLIESDSQGVKKTESWINQPAVAPFGGETGAKIVKNKIAENINQKMVDYMPQIEANGLNNKTNLETLKAALGTLLYEFYTKNGKDEEIAKNYVENVLSPKLELFLSYFSRIYSNKDNGFTNPITCLEAFNKFTKLNFIKDGILQLKDFENTLKIEKSEYERLFKNFEEYLKLQHEISLIATRTVNLQSGENVPVNLPEIFKSGQLKLSQKARLTILPPPAEFSSQARDLITPLLPAELDPKLKEEAIKYLITEGQKISTTSGITLEIGENGSWQIVDLKQEEAAKIATEAEAKTLLATTAPQATSAESLFPKTGIDFIDKILGFLNNLFSNYQPLLATLGIGTAIAAKEFGFISNPETKNEATELKTASEKIGLDQKKMSILFTDETNCTQVLTAKKESKISNWDDYLAERLNTMSIKEINGLENPTPEKLASYLLPPPSPPTPLVASASEKTLAPSEETENPTEEATTSTEETENSTEEAA